MASRSSATPSSVLLASDASRPPKRPRLSQRAPQACTACVKGKRACDKTQPCQQCVKRGIATSCEREVVVVKGQIVGGSGSATTARTVADLIVENAALREQLAQVLRGTERTEQSTEPKVLPSARTRRDELPPLATDCPHDDLEQARDDLTVFGLPTEREPDPRSPVDDGYFFPTPKASSSTALGAGSSSSRHETASTKTTQPSSIHSHRQIPSTHRVTVIPPFLVPLLPQAQLSNFLVSRAMYLVGWMHVAVHTSTFERKCKVWTEEREKLRIERATEEASTGTRREGIAEEEVFLGVDWLALYFAVLAIGSFFLEAGDPDALAAGFSADPLSSHCADFDIHDGEPLPNFPSTVLTQTSYHKFMYELALLARSFNERFCALSLALDRPQLVDSTALALAELVGRYPRFNSPEAYPTTIKPFSAVVAAVGGDFEGLLPWMSYSIRLTIEHRRTLLYRLLLSGQSGSVETSARVICIESARTILAERKKPKPSLFERSWLVGFYTATAAFVLTSALHHHLSTLDQPPSSSFPPSAPIPSSSAATNPSPSRSAPLLPPSDPITDRFRLDISDFIHLLTADSAHNVIAQQAVDRLRRLAAELGVVLEDETSPSGLLDESGALPSMAFVGTPFFDNDWFATLDNMDFSGIDGMLTTDESQIPMPWEVGGVDGAIGTYPGLPSWDPEGI
ncbi:hypothetical protein JCM8547_004371 [Rhodosporidiobolus lusitaniae]